MSSTVNGASVPTNFTADGGAFATAALTNLTQSFGTGNGQYLFYGKGEFTGTDAVPAPTGSNPALIVTGADLNVTLPAGYQAVADQGMNDTLSGGGDSMTALLLGSGTTFNTGTGNDFIYATGSDTINAGAGHTTVIGGADAVTVSNSGGNLYFVGGAGAVSIGGGSTDATLFGGTGTANSVLTGGVNVSEVAQGSGATTMIAGSGNSTLFGANSTGSETYLTSSVPGATAAITLGSGSNSVVGGGGASTIWAGTSTVAGSGGSDVFNFVNGQAGGSETIYGLAFAKSFNFTFAGYSDPVASEKVVGGSDVITLSDNTVVTLVGVDHKVF
jgi:Ca2+-binding RTX toxin-like protein